MKTLLLHPGTQYSHELALQLERIGYLEKFITGLAFPAQSRLLKLIPVSVRTKIANRIMDERIPSKKIENVLLPELISLYKMRRGIEVEKIIRKRNKSFQNSIGTEDIIKSDAIIGFDTSSWIMAERAKQLHKPYFLDQSIAHPREKEIMYNDLRKRYPDWVESIQPKEELHLKSETIEYELARKIVVASSFTKNTLIKQGVAAEKIVINPYGVSAEFFSHTLPSKKDGKTRFLYLGLLGVRKGLPFLLDVWKKNEFSKTSELWLAGPANSLALRMIENVPGVFYKGKVPKKDLPALLSQCNCLVFPSFFEGFGLVILEAMAAGLPVITTAATAGPDIIEHGKDGFIIPVGDEEQLHQAMNNFVNDRLLSANMGKRAIDKAKLFTWNSYGDRWRRILKEM